MEAWWNRIWNRIRRFSVRAADFPPPADPVLLNQVKGWFAEQLAKHHEIPIERRGEYARAAGVIFERMTPTALLRLRLNTREIRFYETLDELTADLARTERAVQSNLVRGIPIGGAYDLGWRRLHLNGGDAGVPNRDILSLYGHEFSHAINGPDREISSSPAWHSAWKKEIGGSRMSLPALTSPQEGFAEFGKFLYSGTVSRKAFERRLPLCVEVWRGYGIW